MSKLVTVRVLDEAGIPTVKTEEVLMSDAIENLRLQNVFTTDDEGIFFQRQLEYIQAQSFDVLYPDLMGRKVFSTNTEGGEGINQITYRSYDKRGEAQIIAGKATDLPRADISGKEYTIDVRTIGNAYGYSRQELAAARLTGMPLDARKSEAARRAYEEKVNRVIFFGSSEHKLGGLFQGPAGFPQETIQNNPVPAGVNGITWALKTPDEVLADLANACTAMWADTKMIHRPNKILISVARYQLIMNTPRSIHSDMSILTWFTQNNMFITSFDQFVPINELETVFGADMSIPDAEGFVVLSDDSSNFRLREPFPYIHLPVQYKGLEFEINCYGRFAGLEIIRPAAIAFWYGI